MNDEIALMGIVTMVMILMFLMGLVIGKVATETSIEELEEQYQSCYEKLEDNKYCYEIVYEK